MPDSTIQINVFNGARQPLDNSIGWLARLSDGRQLSERKTYVFSGLHGPSHAFAVPFFDNFFDDYSVVASPDGFQDSGWFPVVANPAATAEVDILALPRGGAPNFARATWTGLGTARPGFAGIVTRGCAGEADAEAKYRAVLEKRPKPLACFLNIMTALSAIQLPSGKSPLDYYWNIAWPAGNSDDMGWLPSLDGVFHQDRFFCYVDQAILPEVRQAAVQGAFAPEKNPGLLHPGATESYKQTQFDVSNVQLTFHGLDVAVFEGPAGTPIPCVKIEPDMDYYKDLLSHSLLEVIPNALTGELTDPAVAFALRWMTGRRAGVPDFDPLFTVV